MIFCTSKSKVETFYYLNKFKLTAPFVSENGGVLYIPKKWRQIFPEQDVFIKEGDFFKKEFGTNISFYEETLTQISKTFYFQLFNNMNDQDLADLTGLPLELAILAKKREYDLPFYISIPHYNKIKSELQKELNPLKLGIQKGGKFYHISGKFTKADPVNYLLKEYNKSKSEVMSIGLGDSLNDLEMLQCVDIPILIQQKDNTYCQEIIQKIKKVRLSQQPAPKGWGEMIKEMVY